MNTTMNSNQPTVRFFGHRFADTDQLRTTFWIVLLGAIGGLLAAVLHQVVGPAAVPARLLDALVFGGVLVFVVAAWQCTRWPEILGLFTAALAIAVLGIVAPPEFALLVTAAVALVLWHRAPPLRLMGAWGGFNLVLAIGAIAAR